MDTGCQMSAYECMSAMNALLPCIIMQTFTMHLSYWLIFYLLYVGSCGERKLGLEAADERPPHWQQQWACASLA